MIEKNLSCVFCLILKAAGKMGDLITTLDRFEPGSAALYYMMAQGFCRIVSWSTFVGNTNVF